MQNITTKVEKRGKSRILVIEINVDEAGTPSASGKSQVIATTRGNATIPGTEDAKSKVLCKLGLNLYR